MKISLRFSPRLTVTALGLVLCVAAGAAAKDTPATPATAEASAALEADALKSFPYARRSEFTTRVRDAAARLDSQITALATRQKGGVAGGGRAIALEDVQNARTELEHHISKLDDVAEENWDALRATVLAALTQTQAAYDKAAQG